MPLAPAQLPSTPAAVGAGAPCVPATCSEQLDTLLCRYWQMISGSGAPVIEEKQYRDHRVKFDTRMNSITPAMLLKQIATLNSMCPNQSATALLGGPRGFAQPVYGNCSTPGPCCK